ncbi:MAG TPA: hypothetical protein VFX76_01240 [Roseiflexaceae bacterium]|nr:hypothetical protein [Roseiflexaceae bacterium]
MTSTTATPPQRAQLGDAAFAAAWAEGCAMSLEQAVEYAVGNEGVGE